MSSGCEDSCFRGKMLVGKPRGRWEDVGRNGIHLIEIWNWKVATRNREGWRQEIEAMDQKWATVQ